MCEQFLEKPVSIGRRWNWEIPGQAKVSNVACFCCSKFHIPELQDRYWLNIKTEQIRITWKSVCSHLQVKKQDGLIWIIFDSKELYKKELSLAILASLTCTYMPSI